jgi:hypothetical protein
MFKELDSSEMLIGDLLLKKETEGLKFYRECIQKTNQFSTKYVLQKVLRVHQDHIEDLKVDIQNLTSDKLNKDLITEIDNSLSHEDVGNEFDFATLTFREATKLAIKFSENDIRFYEYLLTKDLEKPTKKAIERILYKKSTYVMQLKSEYERLKED